jgi:AsmA protein
MPDLGFKMMIRDGYINNQNVPSPVTNLFLNLDTQLPSLNTDSLYMNIDSIFFNIDKDYFSSVIKLNNLNRPTIHAKMNAEMDLEKWDRAFGIEPYNVKGRYSLHFTADGSYATAVVQKGLRQTDTVITSIPAFNLSSSLSNGSFKYASLPQAINNISFKVNASCPDSNYHHTNFSIEQLNTNMQNDFIKGYFKVTDLSKIDADLKTVLHLDNIKQYYPLDDIALAGNLNIDIASKGNYLPEKKQFPVTKANITLQNGSIKTSYYPHPVEKIQVHINAVNNNGTMADMRFAAEPISFLFEGNPFMVTANLQNFDNLRYNVHCKGTLDVGKIYKVFAQQGLAVDGYIKTDLTLRGLQSDATAGRYGKLYNAGTAEMKNIELRSDYFPQPFLIQQGLFSFKQDKMWFNKFEAVYGNTYLTLNGYLSNVINYILQDDAALHGSFSLATPHFYVDEFMAFNSGDTAATTTAAADSSGVVIIPSNLDVTFNATAKKISYQQLELQNFAGGVTVKEGELILNKTGFTLIDAPVEMNAMYASLSPHKAIFDYHIKADSFDIRRAYNEIKLFHDLATSAANVKGIVSLDYNLSGKLDANMQPIYPSLKGGGVLALENVEVKGLKLFSAVSKETGKDSVNDPNLKKVKIKTTIANNIITLHKTKMKVFGFRPRFEGQISFDGRLNLTGRLGLPPFGIFGIPFTVTGTQDNPQVKLRHAKDSDKIEETQEEPDEEEE